MTTSVPTRRSSDLNTTNPPLRRPLTVDQPPSADPGARALAQQQQRRQHADERLVVGETDHPAGARLGEQPRGLLDVEKSAGAQRSEEHTSELQSLMRRSYAVFCLKKTLNTY